MKPLNKIFNGKKLRAVYDSNKKIYLVSVIDVICAITNSSYDVSRNYWKQLKHRLKKCNHSLTRKTRQIKLIAKDGLYRNTDVMDFKEITKLIQAMPYKTSQTAKNWLCGIANKSRKIAKDLKSCVNSIWLPKQHCFVVCTSVRKIF